MPSVSTRLAFGVAVGALLLATPRHEAAAAVGCGDLAILTSPAEPRAGRPLRIVVAADAGSPADVRVDEPAGGAQQVRATYEDLSWSSVVTIDPAAEGTYVVRLLHEGGEPEACRIVLIGGASRDVGRRHGPTRRDWDRPNEALYAAWVAHMFAGSPGDELSFPSLEPVLRDPGRNFLFDHLGLGEDGPGPNAIPARPDCADLPYLLRAYFAWKMGLPFGFRRCDRGSATAPPRCAAATTVDSEASAADPRAAFLTFARVQADAVHSGNARTALDDDATDFYPVALTRAALRPGTIYADPYGHTLVLTGWVPQTAERSGILYAVDAQPDGTVGRKRFWEGTFLFATVPGAGPGMKAFRPLVRGPSGRARALTNAELRNDPRFTPWSTVQRDLDPDAFQARMHALIDPDGRAPERAFEDALTALVEQLETRRKSVDNGEQFVRDHPGSVIGMPDGAAIFQTSGPWEDYATPSRDFRLIIALDVLDALPARIRRHPELFVLGERTPEAAAADVERLRARRVAEQTVEYTRSDGSAWRLTVADVLARRTAFEMAYNPNDCVETRWGAPDGSVEASTCRRRAPAEQRARMEGYRQWFRESRRPAA